jgi:L-iditol 2-dehydrogenase
LQEEMKVALLYGPGDLRIESILIPQIVEDEVLIKIHRTGICGSDLHFYQHGELGPFKVTTPVILGHESSGRVVQVGANVKNLKVDDRVVVEPGIPCGRCEMCKRGRYNLCSKVKFLSAPPEHGTFAEYVALREDFAHKMPEHMAYDEGALIEPLAVGIHALRRGNVRPGMSVAILGAGPIGLVTMMAAHAQGVTDICMIDRLQDRLEIARYLGAERVINVKEEDAKEVIYEWNEDNGVNIVIEAAGSIETVQLSAELVGVGGTIVLVGWPGQRTFPFPLEDILSKELNVLGVNRYVNVFPESIELVKSKRINLISLITHRFSLEQLKKAFDFIIEKKSQVIKVMISH